MQFRLVDSGWDRILDDAIAADTSRIRVICPFIKERAAKRLLEHGRPKQLQVITRYDLDCFRDGVSDIAALRILLKAGAQIRGVKNLHAKAYLIGESHAIVTSANLTEQGLLRNHEFGFYATDIAVAANCHEYFERLWKMAGPDLALEKLDEWDQKVRAAWASGAGTRSTPRLGDEGKDVGILAEPVISTTERTVVAEQGFVKFFGESTNRFEHFHPVLDEVDRSGCYFACNYPNNKRPRSVKDGALIFMARLVKHPTDILVFGRGIGMHYVDGQDDATLEDIQKRPWKAKWQRYIRVHDVKFVSGTLGNGVSLNRLMEELGSDSFASTKRNAIAKRGNTNPRQAFNQQAAVELTPQGIAWLDEHLERSIAAHGRISSDELDKLDWPKIKL